MISKTYFHHHFEDLYARDLGPYSTLLRVFRRLAWQMHSQLGHTAWKSYQEMSKIGLKSKVVHILHPLPRAPLPHPLSSLMESLLCCVLMLLMTQWTQYRLLHQVNIDSVLRIQKR